MKNSSTDKTPLTRRGYPVERRFRKLLKRHIAYWLGLFITRALREIPLPVCSWALSRIFLIWYVFFVKYRRRTQKHLRQVFGGSRSEDWYRCTTRAMFMNLGRNLAEFLYIPRMSKLRFTGMIDGGSFRKAIAGAVKDGKGALCVTGHIGNWELLAAYCAKFFPTTVIAKRIYFDKFDREVTARRKRLAVNVIYQEDGLRPLLEALRSNRVVGVLTDQDLPNAAGVFVDFLGKEAYTLIAPAALAIATNAPLFVVCMERLPRGKHLIHISAPVTQPETGDRDADRFELTRRCNHLLSSFIKEHPRQWVWFHRRWRTTRSKIARPAHAKPQNTRACPSP